MSQPPERIEKRWLEAHHSRVGRVLKLALLRELIHEFHSRKSQLMTKAHNEDLIIAIEQQLRTLEGAQSTELSEGTLGEVLTPKPKRQKTRVIHRKIGRRISKLFALAQWARQDRTWERAIAEEALHSGWSLVTLTREVELTEVQTKHKELEDMLWPDGIVLFVESGKPASKKPTSWKGRWWMTVRDPKAVPGSKAVFSSAHESAKVNYGSGRS